MKTIRENPSLFKIVTPVDVNCFKNLLKSHPNCPFITSVCRGLWEGFWPWADTHYDSYPATVNESLGMPLKKKEATFLHEQQDHEWLKRRLSGSFVRDLLPGMHTSPIHTVPKPHSDKLQMVINQSAGQYAPNSMIK